MLKDNSISNIFLLDYRKANIKVNERALASIMRLISLTNDYLIRTILKLNVLIIS